MRQAPAAAGPEPQAGPGSRTEEGPTQSLAVVSDVNLANLGSLLRRAGDHGRSVHPRLLPFGEVIRPLLTEKPEAEGEGLFLWFRPESVLSEFHSLLQGRPLDSAKLDRELDDFLGLLEQAAGRFAFTLMASWTRPAWHRGLGMLDMDPVQGAAGTLLRLNLRLAERLRLVPGAFLLDAAPWLAAGDPSEAARMWYLAKTPFSRGTLSAAAQDVRAAIGGIRGASRKVVVVDLDDTLWGGILGDAGVQGLRLGGHDPIGEAYVDFQRSLKELTNRGVILAVVSKNDESTALEAMRSHPEMVIRPDDLAGWRINWRDKARNVAELAEELNLGLDSFVFIDDNPSERGRVREALPEVLVPEWPDDPLRFAATLHSLRDFDQPSLSLEDRNRAQMYVAERRRKTAKASVGSMDNWLQSLDIRITVEALSPSNLPRAAQLLNKTNQMNLTTRRLSEAELEAWASQPDHNLWTFRVADRFGDYGLTGILSVVRGEGTEETPGKVRLLDFILSCRVFGRQVEETMVHLAAAAARAAGARHLVAELVPTEKNKPCRTFFQERSGFTALSDTTFELDLSNPVDPPDWVTLVVESAE